MIGEDEAVVGVDAAAPTTSVELFKGGTAGGESMEWETLCLCQLPAAVEPGQSFTCPNCGTEYVAREKIRWEEVAPEPFVVSVTPTGGPDVYLGEVSMSSPGDGE